jgi:hypothetical protein
MNPLNCQHNNSNLFWHLGIEYARCDKCQGVRKVEGGADEDNMDNNNSDMFRSYSLYIDKLVNNDRVSKK